MTTPATPPTSPVPRMPLVVLNGSKIQSLRSSGTPGPLSMIEISTSAPLDPRGWGLGLPSLPAHPCSHPQPLGWGPDAGLLWAFQWACLAWWATKSSAQTSRSKL